MVKKITLNDLTRDKILNKIVCPYCMKSNKFELREMESGYIRFTCLGCDKTTIMPFKRRY